MRYSELVNEALKDWSANGGSLDEIISRRLEASGFCRGSRITPYGLPRPAPPSVHCPGCGRMVRCTSHGILYIHRVVGITLATSPRGNDGRGEGSKALVSGAGE